MKKKFRSISWKIWYSVTVTIVILLILILFFNIIVSSSINKEFIFDQLKESAKAKKAAEKFVTKVEDENSSFWVAHFRMDKDNDSENYNLKVDKFTRSLYLDNKENSQIIPQIVQNISLYNDSKDRGIIENGNLLHYYYIDWEEDGKSAMVFLTSVEKKSPLTIEMIILLVGLLIISFFASRIVTRRIFSPIKQLEVFAEEVSKKNWEVELPKTDNDEIGMLAKSLEDMRNSLKIAEERDRQFLQSTSHDLKTPVMVIKGYAQSILDGISIDSEKPAAEVIKLEADRLERKITQILRLNTLEHSLDYNENWDIVSIDRILKSLVSKFKVIRPELHWNLEIKEAEIKGDAEALLIAFENILENQMRYAENEINISINNDEHIEVIISNDGPKINRDNPMELFDAYKKDKDGKFGLGLAITKKVLDAHNGRITAYNIENGVAFKINL
ncbi:HAMP domain-containing sensor histidine kinase [Anaerovorax odorimutans]|uniref:HAMP domain-containing sensor histidine kinase n=1 Tax=Anaerovorax odorimutans TaxID=109327 RepID=UPI000414B9F4|nr:HAMP domain-containing sensor histidine kinase [Anaerovorax odorimutans]